MPTSNSASHNWEVRDDSTWIVPDFYPIHAIGRAYDIYCTPVCTCIFIYIYTHFSNVCYSFLKIGTHDIFNV